MTHFRLALLLLAVLSPFAARAEDITVTVLPRFPAGLEYDGYRTGDADLAIEVDSTGKLADCLVTACTRQPFGVEAQRAVRQWTFKPQVSDGQPHGWVRHVTVRFDTSGVRIVQDNPDHPAGLLSVTVDSDSTYLYRTYGPKELDRIPPITHFVAPQSPFTGKLTVEFYVDETGTVRLPAVRDASDERLVGAALSAVSQWHFEPPLRHGKPVLLKAVQNLSFVDKKS